VVLRRSALREEVVVALKGLMTAIGCPSGVSAFSARGPIDRDGSVHVPVVGPGVSAGVEPATPTQVGCES
jgi:hypothetical protein